MALNITSLCNRDYVSVNKTIDSCVFHTQVEKDLVEVVPKKGPIGKTFKKDAALVMKLLALVEDDDVTALENAINNGG